MEPQQAVPRILVFSYRSHRLGLDAMPVSMLLYAASLREKVSFTGQVTVTRLIQLYPVHLYTNVPSCCIVFHMMVWCGGADHQQYELSFASNAGKCTKHCTQALPQ